MSARVLRLVSLTGMAVALAGVAAVFLSVGSGDGTRISAQPPQTGPLLEAGYQSPLYSNTAHWLCRPDIPAPQNVCAGDLSVTSVAPDGQLTVQPVSSAQNAPVDCFWAYSTVDPGPGQNEDIDGPHPSETAATRVEAAPFGRLCNMFAPLYREATLQTLFTPSHEASTTIAYRDVLDAFRYYLGHFNQGRPFILLGHAQGAEMLTRIMSEMIDSHSSLRSQMISAILPAAPIQVPVGGDIGGTFANIRACRTPSQLSCVIGYSSFRETVPPPADSFYGRRAGPRTEDLCTNPASLGGGTGRLLVTFQIDPNGGPLTRPPSILWDPNTKSPPAITTPYAAMPDLAAGQCVNNGQFSYLSVTSNSIPGPRAKDFPGDLSAEWGLLQVDMNIAQGNLLDTVQQQIAAWQRAH